MKRKYDFPACSSTAGKPFESNPKCPLFNRCNEHLVSEGWERIYYTSSKTGKGDLCNTKYKRLETEDVVSMLEINIEGTKNTCQLTAVINTYRPDNILRSLGHKSEGEVIKNLDSLLENLTLPK